MFTVKNFAKDLSHIEAEYTFSTLDEAMAKRLSLERAIIQDDKGRMFTEIGVLLYEHGILSEDEWVYLWH